MRICKNEITDELRRLFNANPLRVPESRYQPLTVLEIKKKRPQPLGEFKTLVRDSFGHSLNIQTFDVAEISGKQTKKIGLSLGLDLLDNFLKAFGMSTMGMQLLLNNTQKISFAFSNVQRKSFSVLELGKILSDYEIYGDTNNIFVRKILNDKSSKLAIVTDVIQSNNFSMFAYDESKNNVKIDVPAIQDYIANANIDVDVKSINSNEIKFNRGVPLSFAFSCVEIEIDENGKFSSGDWINKIRSKGTTNTSELTNEEKEYQIRIMFDDDEMRPLLIE